MILRPNLITPPSRILVPPPQHDRHGPFSIYPPRPPLPRRDRSPLVPLSADAASTPTDIRNAAQQLLKADTGAAILNNTYDRSRTGTEDGCPVGWAECSSISCYPLDGAQCCADGNYCPTGYYCDGDGCCPKGKVCTGAAPPPSTVHVTATTSSVARPTTPASASTSTSTSRATSFSSGHASASEAPTTTSVGFSLPGQSTEFGTVTTIPTMNGGTTSGSGSSTDVDSPSETDTGRGSAATTPAASNVNGATREGGVRFGAAVAVAVAMCLVVA
ncbi:hypothetical protein C8Q80DRAFT_909931 [Daedaleopsis nitida]|nr:hypothetical protein C8Q80DRAFT_909931 [Daedaleopsis nitida]